MFIHWWLQRSSPLVHSSLSSQSPWSSSQWSQWLWWIFWLSWSFFWPCWWVSSALSSQSSRSVISIIIIMFAMINHPEHDSDHDYDHDSNHGDCCDDFDAGVDLCWCESLFVGKGSSCCNWLDLVVLRWWWRMMVVKIIMIMLITWSLMENPGAQEQWWEPGVLTHKWGQPPLSFQDYPDYMDYRE